MFVRYVHLCSLKSCCMQMTVSELFSTIYDECCYLKIPNMRLSMNNTCVICVHCTNCSGRPPWPAVVNTTSTSTNTRTTGCNRLTFYPPTDLVVDEIQVWTVGRPDVRTNEVRRLSMQQLNGITGAMCRSAVLLEDKCVACYLFDGWNHLLRQYAN